MKASPYVFLVASAAFAAPLTAANFKGGPGDGFSVANLSSAVLDGTALAVIYTGGIGSGADTTALNSNTLSGQSISVLFGSSGSTGGGDGFDVLTFPNATLSGDSIGLLLYSGGSGDGHDITNLPNVTLENQSLTALYGGSSGDGFDAFVLLQTALPVTLDADGDGIPASWEALYTFLSDQNNQDANLDQDGDGSSNLSEYIADTNPDDSSSKFTVDFVKNTAGGYSIIYNTSLNRYYRLEISTDLQTWVSAETLTKGTGSLRTQTLPVTTPKRFARVQVKASP